mmetsp:Transcript_21781/g.48860  ORF Transcript_21781/g.48860 Transcript_21781/m.48860 type:complete len:96 (-) Transcript_21781:785-1072(-)
MNRLWKQCLREIVPKGLRTFRLLCCSFVPRMCSQIQDNDDTRYYRSDGEKVKKSKTPCQNRRKQDGLELQVLVESTVGSPPLSLFMTLPLLLKNV